VLRHQLQRAKPMVANMRGHTLFIAGAMIGALFSSSSANAQAASPMTNETWFCTVKAASGQARPPLEFLLQNSYLTAQPLGAPRYRVLDNTRHGLIAADYSADLDMGFVSVYVATVMIDRASGAFTSTLAASDATPEVRTGHCQMHQPGTTIGASAAAGQK
jgi:hypothetical protein